MVDISIQIVNFNTAPFLVSCLETLRVDLAGASFTWQLHVLGNGSNDDLGSRALYVRALSLAPQEATVPERPYARA